MRIRDAHITDAAAIARAQAESWCTTYAGIVPADYLANLSYEEQAQVWSDHLSHIGGATALYVVEAMTGEIVGFAHSGPERTGNPLYTGELYAIYLLAGHQRQGVGCQLTRP